MSALCPTPRPRYSNDFTFRSGGTSPEEVLLSTAKRPDVIDSHIRLTPQRSSAIRGSRGL
jgi:hypothetical protein